LIWCWIFTISMYLFVYYLMSDRYFICSNMQRWKHTRYANIQKVFWLNTRHTHTHRERERLDCFLFNDRERGQLSKMLHLCLCREFSVHYIWITNSVVSRGVRIPQFCHFLFGVLSTIVGFYQFFFWPIYCFSFDVWLLITFLYLQTFFTFPIYLTQRSNSTSIVTILVFILLWLARNIKGRAKAGWLETGIMC
jgi:hypothetical protein